MAGINFVELPILDQLVARRFYTEALAFELTDIGPTYACTMTGDVDLGLQADRAEATTAPLPVVVVNNLEAALSAVGAVGGSITAPIFTFPSGRRFPF